MTDAEIDKVFEKAFEGVEKRCKDRAAFAARFLSSLGPDAQLEAIALGITLFKTELRPLLKEVKA